MEIEVEKQRRIVKKRRTTCACGCHDIPRTRTREYPSTREEQQQYPMNPYWRNTTPCPDEHVSGQNYVKPSTPPEGKPLVCRRVMSTNEEVGMKVCMKKPQIEVVNKLMRTTLNG